MSVEQAIEVWDAGVNAVKPQSVIPRYIELTEKDLHIGDYSYSLDDFSGIVVVGFGKAAADMAAVVESLLSKLVARGKSLKGFVNAPCQQDGSIETLKHITVHPARPAGLNRPTEEAYQGTLEILKLAENALPTELVLVLVSGGGSALSPAPVEGVSLDEKIELTRFLNEKAGASIEELNCVRRVISRIKGGGLRAVVGGKAVHSLILSDVIGDSLEVIASGPLIECNDTAEAALSVLKKYDPEGAFVPENIYSALEASNDKSSRRSTAPIYNHVVGNNNSAVQAALAAAEGLGFSTEEYSGGASSAADIAKGLLAWVRSQAGSNQMAVCVGGGEPRVVVPENPGKGGRNQQIALETAKLLQDTPISEGSYCILSGGTDGEDGPTDAAGAFVTPALLEEALKQDLSAASYLDSADAYHFFEACEGLLKPGLTGTNVCDLWVALYIPN